MDFKNAVILGVCASEHHDRYSPQHLESDVVLLDQAGGGIHPLLYQLRKQDIEADLSQLKRGYVGLPKGAFLLVGQVIKIDREKKLIYISSENDSLSGNYSEHTVNYKHLIVATGITHAPEAAAQEEDFSVALEALIEAIKVSKAKDSVAPPTTTNSNELFKKLLEKTEPSRVDEFLEDQILSSNKSNDSSTLDTHGKRKFHFQL